MPISSHLTPLNNLDGYRRYFTDAEFWAEFIALVCADHNLAIHGTPRSGVPGTYPTFIVSDRWVIKFFGPLFDGLTSFKVEQAVSQLLRPLDFPIPTLVASGQLFQQDETEFLWPYLIYKYIPALSIGDVYDHVSFASRLSLARQLGYLLRRAHTLPLPANSVLPSTWDAYRDHLTYLSSDCHSRHISWNTLPHPLLSEIPVYLLPPSSLLPPSPSPSLIHSDLTRDHLLGDLESDDWQLRAIIDFGDAISGDLFYELVVLHLEIFDADPRILREFLLAYHPSPFHQHDFIRKAMTLTLLHPYDAFATVFTRHHELRECLSLSELASRLWDVG